MIRGSFTSFRMTCCASLVALSLIIVTPSLAGQRLTILHFNDLHGHLEGGPMGQELAGGAARLATLIKNIEQENEKIGAKTIVLVGGDAFTGTLISGEFQGEAEFRVMNEMGVDAMALGNHEFDFGVEVIQRRMGEATFPVLSANTVWKKNRKLFALSTSILKVGDLKIGIIGLTTEEAKETTAIASVTAFDFLKGIPATKRFLPALNRSSDIQIALTHQGVDADVALAKAIPALEAVIGGHDHVKPEEACQRIRGTTPVCQTPAFGIYLGRVDFDVDGRKATVIKTELIPVDRRVSPDRNIVREVARYSDAIQKSYGVVVGRAKGRINHERGVGETPLGNLVADAIRLKVGADVAIINTGGIRRSLDKGKIRRRDLYELNPFDNHIVVLNLTGDQLERTLIHGITTNPKRGFPQVSGLLFRVEGKKVADVQINGQPLVKKRQYKVATVDFLVDGGDGYGFLKRMAPVTRTNILIRDAVTEYISSHKKVAAPLLGRITF